MHTEIAPALFDTERGRRADEIIRACVHCGFCNATCPTYQVRGDELDGPRGRIYLIKGLLESGEANATAREHLDRCLTCRACETTCPASVQYGELAEIGRELLDEQLPKRSWLMEFVLQVVPRPRLLAPLIALGRFFRLLLPRQFRRLLRPPPRTPRLASGESVQADVLLWQGCVQRVVTPEVNGHLAALLQRRGVTPAESSAEQCCGGLALHLGRRQQAEATMRANVSALSDAKQIISTASGCGVTLKEYGRLLGNTEAQTFAAKVRDVGEVLADFEFTKRTIGGRELQKIAWHPPCTLQHGQRLTGIVEGILQKTGYELVPVADSHLCCGSAGAYSLLQPQLGNELKRRKARELGRHEPEAVATANIGCQTHLADALAVPVLHWLELLE